MPKTYTAPTYKAEISEPPANTRCECSDCSWTGRYSKLRPIGDCALTPGDASPAGRCPECDSLAYVEERAAPGAVVYLLREDTDGSNSTRVYATREGAERVVAKILGEYQTDPGPMFTPEAITALIAQHREDADPIECGGIGAVWIESSTVQG